MSHNVQGIGRWPSEKISGPRSKGRQIRSHTTFNPWPGFGIVTGGIIVLGALAALLIQFGGVTL